VAKYDIAQVKANAQWYWPAVIEKVAGIGDDFLTTTHGPCPKCGGADRWRVFEDFSQTGGAICNQCGKFGDGLALIQWFTGLAFPAVLEKVAEFTGTQPMDSSREKGTAAATAKPSPLAEKYSEPPKPVDLKGLTTIEIFDDSPITEGTIKMWCHFKKGM
jgi:phage/plasmid primase-like uncharacterized protein